LNLNHVLYHEQAFINKIQKNIPNENQKLQHSEKKIKERREKEE